MEPVTWMWGPTRKLYGTSVSASIMVYAAVKTVVSSPELLCLIVPFKLDQQRFS